MSSNTSIIAQYPASRNGGQPSPSTLPQLLTTIDELRGTLANLIEDCDALMESADQAVAFIDRRVELARARERRRDRRNRRRKHV